MSDYTATGVACANIAFIKYWGNLDDQLRLAVNGSISMNLAGLTSTTQVCFDPDLKDDRLTINDINVAGAGLERAAGLLERVRRLSGINRYAAVSSINNFPTGAGIASSASGFAALTTAAAHAAGLDLGTWELSRLARTASGSACRSIPGGFVEWKVCDSDECSYAESIAPPEYWDLADCIAVVSKAHKATVSQDGHALAGTSPLQQGRVASTPHRLEICRRAILERDFDALAEVVELDSNVMHAVIMTSSPPLLYWQPGTIAVMQAVTAWRKNGLPVCYTIDAGPNVHVLCPAPYAEEVAARLMKIEAVHQVLTASPGGPAQVLGS